MALRHRRAPGASRLVGRADIPSSSLPIWQQPGRVIRSYGACDARWLGRLLAPKRVAYHPRLAIRERCEPRGVTAVEEWPRIQTPGFDKSFGDMFPEPEPASATADFHTLKGPRHPRADVTQILEPVRLRPYGERWWCRSCAARDRLSALAPGPPRSSSQTSRRASLPEPGGRPLVSGRSSTVALLLIVVVAGLLLQIRAKGAMITRDPGRYRAAPGLRPAIERCSALQELPPGSPPGEDRGSVYARSGCFCVSDLRARRCLRRRWRDLQ